MRLNRLLLLLIVPAIVLSGFGLRAFAAAPADSASSDQALNIEISPLPIQLSAKPGTKVSTDLRIRNGGSKPETLKISLKTFSADGPDGKIVLRNPTPNDTFLNWVSFDRTQFDAPAGQWQTIRMTINVPSSAAFGYYYAVQVGLASPPEPQPGAARLQGAVAIFVLLNAEAPGAERKIEVSKFSANHSTYEFLPVNFTVRVRNSGNVHTAPHGNIFIKRGGRQVAALDVNNAEGQVLPKSNRTFSAAWNDGFPAYTTALDDSGQPLKDSKGNEKQRLNWDFSNVSKLRFGHYTADLLLVYNDGQRDIPITGSLSFWVIPWRLIFIFLLIILAPAVLVYFYMRRRYGKRGGKIWRKASGGK